MSFTPVHSLLGGYILHLSTSSLLSSTGRIAGVSGIVTQAVLGDHAAWRFAFLGGLLASSKVVGWWLADITGLASDDSLQTSSEGESSVLVVALVGLLVGIGTKLGSGCTSGHMLCGASRFSKRSLIASMIFTLTAIATTYLGFSPSSASVSPQYLPIYPSLPELYKMTLLVITSQAATKVARSSATLTSVISGVLFGTGLLLSGMSSPAKVSGFLKIYSPLSEWDPSLMMVVLAGVTPNALHWFWSVRPRVEKGQTPMGKGTKWEVPTRKDIDWKLVTGAVLFGIGWGIMGICPGPALVLLGRDLNVRSAIFVGGIISGSSLVVSTIG